MKETSLEMTDYNHSSLEMTDYNHSFLSDGGSATDSPAPTFMWSEYSVPGVDIMLAIVCIALTLLSTCGNSLAIRAILRLRASRFTDRNNLGSITLVIFLNLAVCDFFQTLFSAPFAALMLFSGRVQPGISPTIELILCNVAGVSFFIMSRASISIVAVLSLVRCYVILRPMNHHSIVNWRNVYIALSFVWIVTILLSVIPFIAGGTYRYWRIYPMCEWNRLEDMFPWELSTVALGLMVLLVYVTPFLLPGFVVIFSCLTTVGALLVARHQKKIATKKDYEKVACDPGNSSISRKQLSAAITTLMVVVTFTLCYLMWWINSLLYLLWKAGLFPKLSDGFIFTELYGHTGYVYVATMGGLLMIYLNSALNPIIYYCRIFSKNSSDFKTSSSGPKGPPSSSSTEFTNRHSIVSTAVAARRPDSDPEKLLDPLLEGDESPTTSDSLV